MKINLPTSNGGLNLRDSLDAMAINDCIQMDNLIPDVGVDRVRKGFTEISTDATDSLIGYNVVGSETVLTARTGTVYSLNVSTGTRTSLKTGLANSDWVYTSFTDGAGLVNVVMCNDADISQIYNGSTLANIGFTIPAGIVLSSPLSFKNRLYFVDNGTTDIYYGGVQATSGTLTKFSVGSFLKKGGTIKTIQNWTQDAGEGVDDLLVIISSEGEVLLYRGLSPVDSSWSLRGTFQISRPVGKRCATKMGGDLIIITEQGYFPLSQVLNQDRANRVAVSDKINPIMKDKDFNDSNWSINWFSKEGWVFVNSPSSTQYFHEQHVLNFKTGAWCRFIGMDALSWLVLGDKLYFCNSNGVFEANSGTTDNGSHITYYKQQAYSKFDTDNLKQIMRIKPRYGVVGGITFNKKINIDFKDGKVRTASSSQTGNQAVWDEAIWDESFWTDEYKIKSFKSSVSSRVGTFISLGIFGNTKEELTFNSLEVLLKVGNGDI